MTDSALTIVAPQSLVPTADTVALLEAFLAGRNARTLRAYRGDLEHFRAFIAAPTAAAAAEHLIAGGHGNANLLALRYRAHLADGGLQPATINRRLAALRSVVAMANQIGMIGWRLDVPSVKSQAYRDTRGPGQQGMQQLLAVLAGHTDPKAIRDRALLRLLFNLALRRGEVISLDLTHLDLDHSRLSILGKGRAEREWLTLPEPVQVALAEWVAVRGEQPGPLFVGLARNGVRTRLTGNGVYHVVAYLGNQAGLTVRPHGLRHAAITTLLDKSGGNIRAVQQFSRHRDVRVIERYDDNRQDIGGQMAKLLAEG